jgi:hypothetical protein
VTADRAFAHSLGLAIGALVVSAGILLVAVFLVYATAQMPDGGKTSTSRTVNGSQLTARIGTSRVAGEASLVTGLKPSHHKGDALLSHHTRFQAESYPYLSFRFEGLNRGQNLWFIWRTAGNPNQLYRMPMPHRVDGATTFNLSLHPDWRGTVTEVGIHLQGDLRGEPLVIPGLKFETHGIKNLLAVIWSEWTGFKEWTLTSINFLKGTPGPAQQETLSPTLAIASWAGGALLLLYFIGRKKRRHLYTSYAAAVMIPWICLDQLWQRDLSSQLAETRYLFGGKSMEEKHLADIDSHLYQYVKRLKEHILPPKDQRVFILHDSSGHNFDRLKVQYYLLPHNIFNYGRFPNNEASRPGDYILWLGQISGLNYDSENSELTWGDGESLRVDMLDQDKLGLLFIVQGNPSGKSASSNRVTSGG